MRIYVDQETGELVEHLPTTDMVGLQPYGFREAKAAIVRASRDRREAEGQYQAAIRELAAAERAYRVTIAQQVLIAKDQHGATVAEQVAKGTDVCAEARERFVIADGLRYAALERLRGCDGDRQGIAQLVKWSQAVSTGPWSE